MFTPSDEEKVALARGGKIKQMADSKKQQLQDKLDLHDLKYKIERQAIIDKHNKPTKTPKVPAKKRNSNGN